MKTLLVALVAACVVTAAPAIAGDYHVGESLPCFDCHNMHYSQTKPYAAGVAPAGVVPLGTAGPYKHLLKNEPNQTCLSCHNGTAFAIDVFGNPFGSGVVRQGGALNSADATKLANDPLYAENTGHSLWSTATAPGGTWNAGTDGLMCIHCHAQHGIASQYRNLLNRGTTFAGKALTYETGGTPTNTKDVFQRGVRQYDVSQVDFQEPAADSSRYANWCKSCHVDFHGSGGSSNMGGASGGWSSGLDLAWKRHPTADVNIGTVIGGSSSTFISSKAQWTGKLAGRRVKVLDPAGKWDATAGAITPSCMSCHKGHGNQNSFGLIFMAGTANAGTAQTEQGDDAATWANGKKLQALCRQCHTQGSGFDAVIP